MKLKSTLRCLAAALALSGLVPAVRAEETAAAAPEPRAGRKVPPPEAAGPLAGILTEEQRASMTQALRGQAEKLRELTGKIRDARRELFTAGLDGKFDEAAVRKQAGALAGLEAEMMVLRVKAMSQIQPPLSPEQIQQIRNAAPAGGARGLRPLERARPRNSPSGARDQNDLPPKP